MTKQEALRKKENDALLKRMKDPNEDLCNYYMRDKWELYSRPPIKKDKEAIEKLYGKR